MITEVNEAKPKMKDPADSVSGVRVACIVGCRCDVLQEPTLMEWCHRVLGLVTLNLLQVYVYVVDVS